MTPTFTLCNYKQVVSDGNLLRCENLDNERYSLSAFDKISFECGTLQSDDMKAQQKNKWICDQVLKDEAPILVYSVTAFMIFWMIVFAASVCLYIYHRNTMKSHAS